VILPLRIPFNPLLTSRIALLNFSTPRGLRLTLSALASSNFATSYQLGSVGVVDGSISYLFSSVPLRVLLTPQSENVPLPDLLRSYRHLTPVARRDDPSLRPPDDTDKVNESLLYGRLYLPQSQLEALLVRRLSPAFQAQFSAVSGQHLRNGGTALGLLQYDVGRYALEGLASTDGGLLGFRGVYNFGGDLGSKKHTSSSSTENGNGQGGGNGDKERIYGRFSTGGEIYYGTLNKSGGISIGARFATLPDHKGTPLSATLTMNPLMGNIAASYAVMAGKDCSLATRMEFNIFSYESSWAVGMELWRKPFARTVAEAGDSLEDTATAKKAAQKSPFAAKTATIQTDGKVLNPNNTAGAAPTTTPTTTPTPAERSFNAKLEWRLDEPEKPADKPAEKKTAPKVNGGNAGPKSKTKKTIVPKAVQPAKKVEKQVEEETEEKEEYAGVVKARLDQNLRLGVLWEGRVKSLLFSLGSGIDLRMMNKPFRTLGLEIQFSS
jgi:distribution and morphology protein 10